MRARRHGALLSLALLLAGLACVPESAHPAGVGRRHELAPPRPLPAHVGPHRFYDPPNRYYIGNDDHTDYMWAGDEVAYR